MATSLDCGTKKPHPTAKRGAGRSHEPHFRTPSRDDGREVVRNGRVYWRDRRQVISLNEVHPSG